MRSLRDERERGFLAAFTLEPGVKLEIALMTPLRAIKNPRIPMGVTFEIRPPNKVTRPRRTRPAPTMMRLRDGIPGLAERAETRRGSSVKRQPPSHQVGAFRDLKVAQPHNRTNSLYPLLVFFYNRPNQSSWPDRAISKSLTGSIHCPFCLTPPFFTLAQQ